jgi:hypothetical protein
VPIYPPQIPLGQSSVIRSPRCYEIQAVVVEVDIVVDRSEKYVQFTGYRVPTRADPSSRGVLERERETDSVCLSVFERDQV